MFRRKPLQSEVFWVNSDFKHPNKCTFLFFPPYVPLQQISSVHFFCNLVFYLQISDASIEETDSSFFFFSFFIQTRSFDSYFVVFQSPSWGMAAPPRPTACIPSCTSTLAPLRSRRCGGHTVSSAAPSGPSWPCPATAAAWVRRILSQTKAHAPSGRKWVVGEQMASGNREETCHDPEIPLLPPHICTYTLGRATPRRSHAPASARPVFIDPSESRMRESLKCDSCVSWSSQTAAMSLILKAAGEMLWFMKSISNSWWHNDLVTG